VPGGGSHRITRGGEGSQDVAEGNREVEEGTREVDKVEGRTAEEEAIAATLGESDRHWTRSRIQRPCLALALTLMSPIIQEMESSLRTGRPFLCANS
jgi:hypothetical protein